jgi:hypothetical protein
MSPASARPPRQAHSQRATSCRNKFLIRDRGSNFTASFDAVFQAAGTRILRTAVQTPRMNAICERLVGTLRRELLDRVLILGEQHLHAILTGYQAHYNTARPHQGIAQHVPDDERDGIRGAVTDIDTQQVRRKPILNGLINEYTRRLRDGTPAAHQADPIFGRDRNRRPAEQPDHELDQPPAPRFGTYRTRRVTCRRRRAGQGQ